MAEESQRVREGRQKQLWAVLKWLLFLTVMLFISRRAYEVWKSAPAESVNVHIVWLVPAAVIYFIGWLPSVWFWRALQDAMESPISRWDAVRAYYISQLGKYVPGKALVLLIRGSMVKQAGGNPLLAGTLAAFETLVFMAAGAALGVAFSAMAFREPRWLQLPSELAWIHDRPAIVMAIVTLVTFATTPFSSWFFTHLSRKIRRSDHNLLESEPRITAKLVSTGVVVTALGWSCHALSFGCVMQSLSDRPFDLSEFPLWMATSTVSMVGGFAVPLAPGGLGVREGIMIEILKDHPHVGPSMAVVVAGLLRMVWFTTELIAAGILFLARRPALFSLNRDGEASAETPK